MSEIRLRDADYERRYDEATIRMLTGTRWCVYCGQTDDLKGPCDVALNRRQGRRLTTRWEDVYEQVGRERKIVNRVRGLVFVPTETGPWHFIAHGVHETALHVWEQGAMWRQLAGLGDRTPPGDPELGAIATSDVAIDWEHEEFLGRVCACGHHRVGHGLTDTALAGCRHCDCQQFAAARSPSSPPE